MPEAAGVFPPSLEPDPVRRALDCLRDGFQIISFDWKYVYVNPVAARHGRRSADELTGKSMIELYPGIDSTPLFDVLRRCMQERTGHVFENQFTFPDGSTRWFELRVQPVPMGLCIYSWDIEDRKRRESAAGAGPSLLGRVLSLFRAGPRA